MALNSVSDDVVGDFEVADDLYDMFDDTTMLDLPEAEAGEINGPISGAAAHEICFGTVDRDVMLEAKAAELERKLEVAEAVSAALQAETDEAKEVAATAVAKASIAAQELKLTA